MGFRCYSCDRERKDADFAGVLAGKKICKICARYVDERDIAGMISLEERGHAHRVKKIGRDRNK